jgi:hypothetical protein
LKLRFNPGDLASFDAISAFAAAVSRQRDRHK